jgi:hypothetical protein
MKQLVIMPGGFHPFHAGHAALYQSAVEAFPGADVYVAATNDTSTRPFPFPVKEKLAQLAGVPKGRFTQVKSPFRAEEIVHKYNPDNTQLIFVRSEKDAGSQPRPGGTKKDGTPSYLQPYNDASDQPLSQRAYMAYLPTVEFGPGMTSATEIRGAWPKLTEKRKTALVMSLYPKTQTSPQLAATVVKILDAAIGGVQDVAETINPSIRNKRFAHTQVIGDYTYKASVEWFIGSPLLYIKAYDGDKQIGEILFEIITRSPGGKRDPSADYLESGGTEVEPEYRNKGVASTMYAYAKMLGNDIVPSDNQRPDGKAMWAAWKKSGDAKHLIGTAAESTIAEGPYVQRIVHPRKINIYVRPGASKPPLLVATDIPYKILDRYIAKVISKYPQFKPSDFSFEPSDKVSENQGWAATYEALKPDAFAALQQAKQNIEQNRQQEVDQWTQDFRANSSKLAGQQLKQRLAAPPPAPIPVARPGEGFYALKDRLAQLDIAKQKFEVFNKLIASIKKKYPLVADTLDQLENSLLQDVKDGAADNYASLLTKLGKYETALTTRFPGIVKEDPDYIDEYNNR